MANFFVVFEPAMAYQVNAIEAALAQLETPFQRVLPTTWLVNSFLQIGDLFHHVSAIALPSDRFLVVRASDAMFDNLIVAPEDFAGCWDSSNQSKYAR